MDRAQYARAMDEHERLKRLYAKAVSNLFAIGYRVTDSEYHKLKVFAEDVRIDLEIARQRSQKSIRERNGWPVRGTAGYGFKRCGESSKNQCQNL